jgi:hypothetical protein
MTSRGTKRRASFEDIPSFENVMTTFNSALKVKQEDLEKREAALEKAEKEFETTRKSIRNDIAFGRSGIEHWWNTLYGAAPYILSN